MQTESRQAQAEATVKRAGYATGGGVSEKADEKKDRQMIRTAVHKHERHDHPGKPETKLRAGGQVMGAESGHRPDRKPRGKIGSVNIRIGGGREAAAAEQMGEQKGMQAGAALGARAAAAKMGGGPPVPPRPMPNAMPPGAVPPGVPMAPPGAAGMRAPMPVKRGGEVKKRADGGGLAASMREPGVVKGGAEHPYKRERA